MGQTNEERKQAIQRREAATPSAEAAARKERSLQRLQTEGVPTIAHLPVIEDSKQAKVRTKEEVARRAIAVCLTAVKGEGLEQEIVDRLVKQYGASQFFSPREATFIKDAHPDRQTRVQFSWWYEDLWVLLWALSYVDTLNRLDSICDVSKAVGIIHDRTTDQFIRDAKLRPIAEILDQADLSYRYDWAVVNTRVKGQEAPAKLEKGVVLERHYTLNWLIGYLNQAWDEVTTDT